MQPRILEVRKNLLKKNDELAGALRSRFLAERILCVNLVSSPGSGKTSLLQRTLREGRARGWSVAAIVGDLATDNDARRLAESGAPVRQINTDGVCHLNAEMIGAPLRDWPPERMDMLFIENVGNLVCTASYDLGESVRVALISTTEGEDKPLKYPSLFNSADITVITKMDLAMACEFDREATRENLRSVRPGMRIFETSAKTGAGFEEWLRYLEEAREALGAGGVAPVG